MTETGPKNKGMEVYMRQAVEGIRFSNLLSEVHKKPLKQSAEDVKLQKLVSGVARQFDLRKISAEVHKTPFRGVSKIFPSSLRKRFPTARIMRGGNLKHPAPNCFVWGEVQNGVYLIKFVGGVPAQVFLCGRHRHWVEMLWVDAEKGINMIRYLPYEEGGIYPHCYDPVQKSDLPILLKSYEPRPEALECHKVLRSAVLDS